MTKSESHKISAAKEHLEKQIDLLHDENRRLKSYTNKYLKEKVLIDELMENIPDQIFFKDIKSRYTLINKSCAEKFGLESRAAIIDKTDEDFFEKKYARSCHAQEEKIIRTGKPLIGKEMLEIWPDGRETWTHITKMPLYNKKGIISGTFGVSRDITDMKHMEHLLQVLMDSIPDAIFFKDQESRFIRINKGCADVYNLADPSDVQGRTDFDFFPQVVAQQWRVEEKKIMETGNPVINREFYELAKDSEERWLATTKMPLRDKKGIVMGTFGIARDITKFKLAERALQISNEKLEKKVKKRTAELQMVNEGMKVRIQQLNYLNSKARFFAQLVDRDALLSAIYYAFLERFPDSEVHLCTVRDDGFRTALSTERLSSENLLESCREAIQFKEEESERDILFTENWENHQELKDAFKDRFEELPCYLEIPLFSDKKIRGIVQIFAPSRVGDIFDQEKTLLHTLASQAAVSLDNANNYVELQEKTKLESELEIARDIQKKFMPHDPVIPNIVIKGVCMPAKGVGGDYLDYFQNEEGNWVIVIADVCGKGIPAALVMTTLRGIFRAEARRHTSSKELIVAVNNIIGNDLRTDRSFITCLVMILDQKGNAMNVTRAGHPMLISFSTHTKPKLIPSEGIALGLILNEKYESFLEEVSIDLKRGDKFLGYTDGLDEAMNSKQQNYGLDRLFALLESHDSVAPEDLVAYILDDIRRFCEAQPQSDDLTLFVMEKVL